MIEEGVIEKKDVKRKEYKIYDIFLEGIYSKRILGEIEEEN